MTQPFLRIAVIEENAVRAAILVDGLREGGMTAVEVISSTDSLMRRLMVMNPDVIIIGLENPRRDVLEQMFQVSKLASRPVAMFVDQAEQDMIEAAVNAGVSAYVVDGLRKDRVKAIVEMAISRFNAFDRLQRELDATKAELAGRKVIERAKGILMRTRQIGEEQAYALLRQASMSENRKVSDVAQAVVTAASLLEK
ncbi:MAG: ANTAR domain-containing protein [Bauldia sp.]|nr:ANTAR domain-containing protein [Bauldia sp.]